MEGGVAIKGRAFGGIHQLTINLILRIPAIGGLGSVMHIVHIPANFVFLPLQRIKVEVIGGVSVFGEIVIGAAVGTVGPDATIVQGTVYARLQLTGLGTGPIGRG